MTPLRPGQVNPENEGEHNVYAREARANKVKAMSELIDLHIGDRFSGLNGILADNLEEWPRSAQLLLASAAGVREPSKTTWRELVRLYRERATNNPKPVVYPALEVVR
jgi:hypothetical protein